MSERIFLFITGAFILFALYFNQNIMIYGLCVWLLLEGMTNLRLTTLSQRLLKQTVPAGLTVFDTPKRFNVDSFRVWRLVVAVMLGGSFLLVTEYGLEVLWFFPWFMGFAILGAGASGVCPVLLFIRWIGFR